MFTVELYARIRRAVMVDGLSRREAATRFGVHRNTITKMLQYSVPPGYRRRERPASKKLGPILEADRGVHRPLQFVEHIVEHRMEPAGLNRVKLRADLTVAGDLGHPEQRLAVRAAPFLRQMALVFQKGRTLHEENRKRGEPEIRHFILRVGPGPLLGQRQAAAAQRGQ